jgi:NADPH-dependent F420 reductase
MRIGILGGTGPAGSSLGARLASIGYEVVIGSRSKYRAMEARDHLVERSPELAESLTYGDNIAAADCDVVIATPWDSAATTAQEHSSALRGKVVISMANALVRVGHEFQPLVPPRGSVAAHVQAAVPGCRVVAAMHHLPAKELGHLGEPIDSDVLICGDDPSAVETVSEIVAKIPGCRPLDAGELSNATAIEAFTAVLLQLNVRYRTRVAPKLTGIRRDPRAPKRAEPTAAEPTAAEPTAE